MYKRQIKDFLDNKKFWKNVKPLFSDKGTMRQQICIVQGNQIISDNKEVAETFNKYFVHAIDSLQLKISPYLLNSRIYTSEFKDPIDIIIEEFASHPSILKIKEMVKVKQLSFKEINIDEIDYEISRLNPKKATTFGNIPTKIIKETKDISAPILHRIANSSMFINNQFPDKLKLPDVSPLLKGGDATDVKNYTPVSIPPPVSKIFERLIQKQLLTHIDQYLSPYMCGYRKGYSAQYALVSLLEKWKESLDKKGYAGAMLMDLSKAFDTIDHNLLIAKLHAYGLSRSALKLIKSYLSNRWQRTKINTSFSSWTELKLGVPQGSVLGPILFNIYLNNASCVQY